MVLRRDRLEGLPEVVQEDDLRTLQYFWVAAMADGSEVCGYCPEEGSKGPGNGGLFSHPSTCRYLSIYKHSDIGRTHLVQGIVIPDEALPWIVWKCHFGVSNGRTGAAGPVSRGRTQCFGWKRGNEYHLWHYARDGKRTFQNCR